MDTPLHSVPWTEEDGEVTEELRVSVNEFKGKQYFAVRIWYRKDGDFRPGKAGMNIPLERADDLMKAIIKGLARWEQIQKRKPPVTDARD